VGHLRNWRRPSSLSGQETQQNVLPNKEEIKKEMVNIPNKTVSAEYITEILSSFVRPHTLSLSLSLSLSLASVSLLVFYLSVPESTVMRVAR